jgi:Clp amino terminal domain, pathogenicity island component
MAETPSPAHLVSAIERDHPGGDVDVRLEAALRLTAELRAVGDQVVDYYVQAARNEGRSWTEIGEVLGITKQGAQKRFAAPAAAAPEPWPAGFGADAQAVFAEAVDEARALGHRYVGTEHLLLGLFSDRAGLAKSCLTRLSMSRESVRAQVIERIGRGDHPAEGSLGITPRTKRVFEHARRESRRLGHRCPLPEHLLLALFSVRDGVAREILAGSGASEERTRETLAELLSGHAPELAERIRRRPRRRLARH